ncbi:CGNR zinc finger domain-containing protein [Geminicoccus flavidas]|uniref:CGNR zinc finger domain-containing protein n=1 Tax=Geminicoccus flavidas TaxID=2506407 RepID=UPI0013592FA5|nr:CGNR zinc finger domain-containing protein [Geminicoccus flavidas]
MAQSRAGSLALVGGVLALDFANTAGGRDLPEPIEHLQAPRHLLDWSVHASVLPPELAGSLHATLAADPKAAQALLEAALGLREAIHRVGSAIAQRRTPAAPDLATLRQVSAAALAEAQLAPDESGRCSLRFAAAPATAAILGPIAWSALDLLRQGDLARLKQCPAADCGWLFLDTTRNGSRRWCDMATCGNRTKARRHRHSTA